MKMYEVKQSDDVIVQKRIANKAGVVQAVKRIRLAAKRTPKERTQCYCAI